MNTTLFIVPKPTQLTSVWVPSGDPRTPLVRRWIDAALSPNQQEGGLFQCA